VLIKGLKLAAGVLFGIATLWMAGFQVYRVTQGVPLSDVFPGCLVILLPGAASFFFFYSALKGDQRLFRDVALEELLADARRPAAALPTDVIIEFETYTGLVLGWVSEKWALALPPDYAREVLWTLHRRNMITAWLAPPFFVVNPLLSWVNYRNQLRSVEEQIRGAGRLR
jgi:hypothetical protein